MNLLRVKADDPVMFDLMQRAAADRNDIECLLFWCPRALNGISDSLSKSLIIDRCRSQGRVAALSPAPGGLTQRRPSVVPPTLGVCHKRIPEET